MKTALNLAVKSKRIYTENGIRDGYLLFEKGKIKEITDSYESNDFIDFGNNRIIPGIFDTHNHGTQGYVLANAPKGREHEYIKGYLKGLGSQGVTGIFPTCSLDMIPFVKEVSEMDYTGAKILGIHSEGPWLNRAGEKGVKPGWPEVSVKTAEKMIEDSGGLLKLVAAAPEIEGIGEVLEYFKSQGITLSYAHSDMYYEEASKALKKYFTVSTHTGNVMTGIHHRDVGGLGACLLDKDITCEVICDGMHISLQMLEIYFRVKDYSKFMLVSDCTGFSGAPAGRYKGDEQAPVINVNEEGFILSDTGKICGSSKPVLYGIYNLVEKMNIPLETVIEMASLNPAEVYGFAHERGSLKQGKYADFTVIDDNYNVIQTYRQGRKIYDCKEDGDIYNKEFLVPAK